VFRRVYRAPGENLFLGFQMLRLELARIDQQVVVYAVPRFERQRGAFDLPRPDERPQDAPDKPYGNEPAAGCCQRQAETGRQSQQIVEQEEHQPDAEARHEPPEDPEYQR